MKKFLCYDTNDAASGKINVSTNGMLNPNSTVPSTNGASYQQLVTDGAGNVKWEDKPFGDVKSNIPGEIYEAGYTEFDNVVIGNDLIISEEIWNVLLTKESSLIINDTGEQYEFSRETDARIEYTGDGNPSAGNLFVCKDSPKAYFYSARPDATLGVKYMVSVPYEYAKQIDPKYIPNPNVIVNITETDGTFSADKTFDEVKALIDNGADVKCILRNNTETLVGDLINSSKQSSLLLFESTVYGEVYLKAFIVFTPDEIFVEPLNIGDRLLPAVSAFDNNKFLSAINGAWRASSDIIIPSSTSGSSKKFKITVDDSGAITATEV